VAWCGWTWGDFALESFVWCGIYLEYLRKMSIISNVFTRELIDVETIHRVWWRDRVWLRPPHTTKISALREAQCLEPHLLLFSRFILQTSHMVTLPTGRVLSHHSSHAAGSTWNPPTSPLGVTLRTPACVCSPHRPRRSPHPHHTVHLAASPRFQPRPL
jgi:hypothetical protein